MGIEKKGRFSPFSTQCRETTRVLDKNLYKQKEIIGTEGKKYFTLEICVFKIAAPLSS